MSATRSGELTGPILTPGDPGYEDARRIWNGAIDRRPALIVRPPDAAGVAAAILHARAKHFPLAVRGGGHSVAGHSVCNGGLVIDLSALTAVEVDVRARTARVGGGALLADLDRATQDHALVVPAGHVSHTGVGGLTLGGGTGWLMRKLGLTIDNVLSVELVAADGAVVRASERENPDLFWGVRGGGGNFGVVTEFEFRLHELGPTLLAGMLVHPLERAREVLAFSREFMATAPDELTTFPVLVTAPPAEPFPPELQGRPVLALGLAYAGPVEEGERAIAPLRALGGLDLVQPMPYVALQTMLDASVPHGLHTYNTAGWLRDLDEGAIDVLVDRFAAVTSPLSQLILGRMGGAVARVPADGTAFVHRDAGYLCWIVSSWPPDAAGDADVHVAWARETAAALRPYETGGAYVNALGAESSARVRSAYGSNWNRLVDLKRRWDPENVFQLNQNIPPES